MSTKLPYEVRRTRGGGPGREVPVSRRASVAVEPARVVPLSGQYAWASALENAGRDLGRLADPAFRLHRSNVLKASQKEAIQRVRLGTFEPLPGDTEAQEAFNAAGTSAYLAKLGTEVHRSVEGLQREANGNPAAFDTLFDGYQSGLLSEVPEELQGAVELTLLEKREQGLLELEAYQYELGRREQKASILVGIETARSEAEAAALRGDEGQAEALMQASLLSLQDGLDARLIDPIEAAQQTSQVQLGFEQGIILGRFVRSGMSEGFIDQWKKDALGSLEAPWTITEVLQTENKMRSMVRKERSLTSAMLKDDIAIVQAGGPGLPGTVERARREMEPDDFAEFMRSRELARVSGNVERSMPTLTPDQMGQLIEAFPGDYTEGFADRQRAAAHVAQLAEQEMRFRERDPGMAVQRDPEVALEVQGAIEGGNLAGAIDRTLQAQGDVGIPEARQRALDEGRIKTLAGTYQSAPYTSPDPNIPSKALVLQQLDRAAGPHADKLFRDLVEVGKLDSFAPILREHASDPVVGAKLAVALETPESDYNERVPRDDREDIDAEINDLLADWRNAAVHEDLSGALLRDFESGTVQAMRRYALQLASEGADPSDAANQAFESLLDSRMQVVDGTLRVPRDIDAGRLEDDLSAALDEGALRAFNPTPLGQLEGDLPEDLRREALIDQVLTNGYWITDESGENAVLMLRLGERAGLPVVNERGERYQIPLRGGARP